MRLIDADAFGGIVKDGGMIDEHATVVARNAMLAMPTVDAVPLEYISRYQKTCDGDLAMALEDLKASWQIVGPTWKPKR